MTWKQRDQLHRRKLEKYLGLQALLQEHEAAPTPDVAYIKDLLKRIRTMAVQLGVSSQPKYEIDL